MQATHNYKVGIGNPEINSQRIKVGNLHWLIALGRCDWVVHIMGREVKGR